MVDRSKFQRGLVERRRKGPFESSGLGVAQDAWSRRVVGMALFACAWPLASEVEPRRTQSHQAQDIHTSTASGSKVGHIKPLRYITVHANVPSVSELPLRVRPQIVHLSALQPSSRFVRRAFCYLCVRYGFRGRFSREFTRSVRLSAHVLRESSTPRTWAPRSAHGLRSFRSSPRSISPRLFKRPVAVHTRHRPRHVRKSEKI